MDRKNWAFHVGATFLMKVHEDKVLGVITFIWTHMTFALTISNVSQNAFTERVHVDLINISHPIRSIDCHNSFVQCVVSVTNKRFLCRMFCSEETGTTGFVPFLFWPLSAGANQPTDILFTIITCCVYLCSTCSRIASIFSGRFCRIIAW